MFRVLPVVIAIAAVIVLVVAGGAGDLARRVDIGRAQADDCRGAFRGGPRRELRQRPRDRAAATDGGPLMDSRRALTVLMALAALLAAAIPSTAGAKKSSKSLAAQELVTFAAAGCAAACGSGSTIGPDKALYVTDGPGGRVLRIDPKTGVITTFASGLPVATPDLPFGGAQDVAFFGGTAYVLVTAVGPFFGQANVVDGLYRIAKNGTPTAIADIGAWSIAHPPAGFPFVVTTGVQYALQKFRGGFLV